MPLTRHRRASIKPLPPDLVAHVLGFLQVRHSLSLRAVCRSFAYAYIQGIPVSCERCVDMRHYSFRPCRETSVVIDWMPHGVWRFRLQQCDADPTVTYLPVDFYKRRRVSICGELVKISDEQLRVPWSRWSIPFRDLFDETLAQLEQPRVSLLG